MLRRPTLLSLSTRAGQVLPRAALRRLAGRALAGLNVSLCLHRVARRRRPTDWQPELTISPDALDDATQTLLDARGDAGWLTLSFDDGYADSAEYIATRAGRWPGVRFAFFVCPEKLEQRAGFRWDLVERALAGGAPRHEALKLLDAPLSLDLENRRDDLRALASDPDFRLATVAEVKALMHLPNVTVGNHTNMHARATGLADAVAAEEYRRSHEAFSRLFGPATEVAFPFGTPGLEFSATHVAQWRALGDFTLWTTESRPWRPSEYRPGAVLPRFAVDGRLSGDALVAWIAARAAKYTLRGSPHHFS